MGDSSKLLQKLQKERIMTERLFVHDRNLYERKMQPHEIEHAQVNSYEKAILLPLQVNSDVVRDVSHVYQGGGMFFGL